VSIEIFETNLDNAVPGGRKIERERLHLAAFRQALEKQQTSFHCGPYAIEPTTGRCARDFKARVYAHGAVIATLEHNGSYRPTRYGWLLVSQSRPALAGLHEIIHQLREGVFDK